MLGRTWALILWSFFHLSEGEAGEASQVDTVSTEIVLVVDTPMSAQPRQYMDQAVSCIWWGKRRESSSQCLSYYIDGSIRHCYIAVLETKQR